MKRAIPCWLMLSCSLLLVLAAHLPADDFPTPKNTEKSTTSPMAPDEVVKTAKLPPNAVPCFIQIVTEIPKTASEKPQERFLLAMFDAQPDTVFDVTGGAALAVGTGGQRLHGQRPDNNLHG